MIEAIKETLALHERALKEGVTYLSLKKKSKCPLCVFAKKKHNYKKGIFNPEISPYCFKCPWTIFEGHPCASTEELLAGYKYSYYDSKKSIERLKRWLRELEE